MLPRLPAPGRIAERLILYLPQRQRPQAQHFFRRNQLHGRLRRRLGRKFMPVDVGPAAPPGLVAQTSVLYERDIAAAADRHRYFAGGYLGTLMILETVERFGFDLRTAEAVLDFGCGAGKVTRLFRGIEGIRVVGTDVNAAQVHWAQEHVAGVEFYVNDLEPPLRFADDDTFGLVFAMSVFTHIPLHLQRPWLEEIRRILKPGGYFLCTVAGAYHIDVQLSPDLRKRLREEGQVTLTPDDPGVSHATKAAGSWDVFQTREEVLRCFGSVFEVLHYGASENGQDNVVLRKR